MKYVKILIWNNSNKSLGYASILFHSVKRVLQTSTYMVPDPCHQGCLRMTMHLSNVNSADDLCALSPLMASLVSQHGWTDKLKFVGAGTPTRWSTFWNIHLKPDMRGIFHHFIIRHIQLRKMNMDHILNKSYVNEVTLTGQNLPLKCC